MLKHATTCNATKTLSHMKEEEVHTKSLKSEENKIERQLSNQKSDYPQPELPNLRLVRTNLDLNLELELVEPYLQTKVQKLEKTPTLIESTES